MNTGPEIRAHLRKSVDFLNISILCVYPVFFPAQPRHRAALPTAKSGVSWLRIA
jgi:hypothetical protein